MTDTRKENRIIYAQYFFLALGMFPDIEGWQKARKKAKEDYIIFREIQCYARRMASE